MNLFKIALYTRSRDLHVSTFFFFFFEQMDSLTSNNQFTARKMASQGLIDVALMMANISQLRTLITAGQRKNHR